MQAAYVLHRYPYQDQHFLLKVLTIDQGVFPCIAKYAKRAQSAWYGLLQPFQPIAIECRGRGEVLSVKQAEPRGPAIQLGTEALWSGFYLNELLLSFLSPHDAHPELFTAYTEALLALQTATHLEHSLRCFELALFQAVGVLPDLSVDHKGEPLHVEAFYQLQPHHLPVRVTGEVSLPTFFQGEDLLAISRQDFTTPAYLKAAKRFSRVQLDFYLPKAGLKTRDVFAQVFQGL